MSIIVEDQFTEMVEYKLPTEEIQHAIRIAVNEEVENRYRAACAVKGFLTSQNINQIFSLATEHIISTMSPVEFRDYKKLIGISDNQEGELIELRLEGSLYQQLRDIAALKGTSIDQIVEEALKMELKKEHNESLPETIQK